MAVMMATTVAEAEAKPAVEWEMEGLTEEGAPSPGVDSLTTLPTEPDTSETEPVSLQSESEAANEPAPSDTLPLDIGELQREIRVLRQDIRIREQWENEIAEQNGEVERHAARVMRATSAVEAAKGELKSAKELYDQAVNALRELLKDHGTGQQRLPFEAVRDASVAATITTTTADGVTITTPSDEAIAASLRAAGVNAEAAPEPLPEDGSPADSKDYNDFPVEVLLSTEIKNEFGSDYVQQAKDRDEPIGMTPKQLEKLHESDVRTIGKLEKTMRENRHWSEELGLGEKTAARLVETLRVWRTRYPHSV